MNDQNRPCLIGQTNCGRELGNPVCPWCGIDERVVYPSQADLEEALAQAKADYQRRLDDSAPKPMPKSAPAPTPPAIPRKSGSGAKWGSFAVGGAIVVGLGTLIAVRHQEQSSMAVPSSITSIPAPASAPEPVTPPPIPASASAPVTQPPTPTSAPAPVTPLPTPASAPAPKPATTPEAQPYLTENQVYALYLKVNSDETARKTLISEAERGNRYAQYNLGQMYEYGSGVAKNDAQAVAWYRKAAEQGYAHAQYKLGQMYYMGRGIAENSEQAVVWFRKAAEQGIANAQYELGRMYEQGQGIAQNDVQAVAWFRKAAEKGNAYGQYHLGLMYDAGRGVPKDHALAISWIRKAADQGHFGAKSYLANNN